MLTTGHYITLFALSHPRPQIPVGVLGHADEFMPDRTTGRSAEKKEDR